MFWYAICYSLGTRSLCLWHVGQTRECYLYRFFSTGSLEETILERHTVKEGLLRTLISGKLPPVRSLDRHLCSL